MSKPWRILYRQNSDALASGVVAVSGIPSQITPLLTIFEVHHTNENPVLESGETAEGPIGTVVWFYLEFTDPDGLFYGFDLDRGDEEVESYDREDLTVLGTGFLFSHTYMDEGEFTPEITLKWGTYSGSEQTVVQEVSNPPVSIVPVEAEVSPTDVMIGDLVTLVYNYPEVVDSSVVEWGDE